MLQDVLALPAQQADTLVDAFFQQIGDALAQQQDVKLYGFGNFIMQQKSARPGRNPRTGEHVRITPRKTIVFRPGRKLKKMLYRS